MKKSPFFKQAELMLKCIPSVEAETVFALKGGTAINMFVQNLPRLSVDIDLTYLPIEDRTTSIKNINNALKRISTDIKNKIKFSKVHETEQDGQIIKLVISTPEASIKIEPNFVLRGCSTTPQSMDLVQKAQDLFGMSASIMVVSTADLYGGKICAALDRQHPRDFFDIKLMYETEGFTDKIRIGFLIYLASHDRPMHELLNPTLKDISTTYEKEFKDMAEVSVSLDELYRAREKLILDVKTNLSNTDKKFLISLKSGKPEWNLIPIADIDKLPALQWKLLNVKKMAPEKHAEQLEKLKAVLG